MLVRVGKEAYSRPPWRHVGISSQTIPSTYVELWCFISLVELCSTEKVTVLQTAESSLFSFQFENPYLRPPIPLV